MTKVEVSYKTIVFTVFFLIFLWLVYQVKDIIFLVFISFIIMSAFKPLADKLERFHLPRLISILLIYVATIAVLGFAFSSLLPPLITQTIHLGENLPTFTNSLTPFIRIDFQTLTQQVAPIGENLLRVTFGIFSNLIGLFTLFVISFYLLLQRNNLESMLDNFMGKTAAERIIKIVKIVELRLGAWVRGQLTLALTVGLATFIGLFLLGIPYTLPLAIFAAIFEIVPTVGPVISAVPALLVALTVSPFLTLATAALYFIIQQIEAQVIVPLVMKRAVGLSPLTTIIALMAGFQLSGIVGAVLSVPVVVTIESIISEYLKLKDTSRRNKSTEAHKPDSVFR